MTTLIALSTKDALVMGCDSLATTTRDLVDPIELLEFFEHEGGFALKYGEDGKPLLKEWGCACGWPQTSGLCRAFSARNPTVQDPLVRAYSARTI